MAAVLGIGVIAGRWFVDMADSRCDPANMVGGACVEPWQTGTVEIAIYTVIVFVTLLLTLLPWLLAPALKRTVATVSGLLLPLTIGVVYVRFGWADFLLPMLVAAAVAVIGICWVFSRRKQHAP
jgi:hypothetical protein